MWRALAGGALLGILAAAPPQGAEAQQGGLVRERLTALGPLARNVPFHPGEEMKYSLRARGVGRGEAVMRVGDVDAVHGRKTLPLEFLFTARAFGGLLKLNEKFYSWMDPVRGISLRFVKEQKNGERYREYEFFPEEQRARRIDHDTAWALPSVLPLDDLSFVYFVRTLPLEVGDSHTLHRYFKDEGNPITITVLRRDSVVTRAGAFNTIVVQPVLPESSLFPRSARAEIHFSDDDHRAVVFMRVTRYMVPLTMELTEFTPGTPARRGEEGRPGPPARRPSEGP